jgi:hypothetical protein
VIGPAELLGQDHREEVVRSLSAVGRVVLESQHPDPGHFGEDLMQGNPLLLLPFRHPGIDLVLHERTHHPPELAVLGGEGHVWGLPVAGHRFGASGEGYGSIISPEPVTGPAVSVEGSDMGKFIRRMLMGAAVVWGVKSLQDKRREWSGRSPAEIRQEVVSKLPATMDEEAKQKVADKVVQAVKGNKAATTSPVTATTPPPETPMSTPAGTTPPPPPPAGEEGAT